MRILRSTSRIQDKDENGEPYFLDESAIQSKMASTNVTEAAFVDAEFAPCLTLPAQPGYIYQQETGNGSLS